jgi:hypothetical protein
MQRLKKIDKNPIRFQGNSHSDESITVWWFHRWCSHGFAFSWHLVVTIRNMPGLNLQRHPSSIGHIPVWSSWTAWVCIIFFDILIILLVLNVGHWWEWGNGACWDDYYWLLWIIPENSLRLAPVIVYQFVIKPPEMQGHLIILSEFDRLLESYGCNFLLLINGPYSLVVNR